MAFVEALSAWAAIPLRLLQHRNRRVERWLGLAISAGDEQAIRIACHRNGVRFGAYYHWYLIKLLLRRQLRRMSRPTMGRMIADTDSSDYGPLDSAMNDPRGLLIAIPHHGHYVLSMASLAAKISLRREVLVFYGDPKTHPGNEIFDDLHVLIYEGAESRVTIIHDNRAGLSKAIRALQNGSAVLIMPDVYKDLDDTFQLPFCGRPYDVMLGTAALARRTHSNILPTVAIPIRPGIRFANQFGPLLHGRQPNSVTAAVTSFEDYKVTAAMFHAFEAIMDSEIHHWQFVRQHYQRSGSFPVLDEDQLESLTELVLRSSKVALNPSAAIDCSNCVEAIEWNDTTRWN